MGSAWSGASTMVWRAAAIAAANCTGVSAVCVGSAWPPKSTRAGCGSAPASSTTGAGAGACGGAGDTSVPRLPS
eukprot:2225584-Amphidinium_carterae.1